MSLPNIILQWPFHLPVHSKAILFQAQKMFPLFSVRMHILLPISSYRSFASPDEIFMSGGPICKEKKVFNL